MSVWSRIGAFWSSLVGWLVSDDESAVMVRTVLKELLKLGLAFLLPLAQQKARELDGGSQRGAEKMATLVTYLNVVATARGKGPPDESLLRWVGETAVRSLRTSAAPPG